ncbi:unknown protein [Seminavis robusta]|uniref:Uncharacterized protein n=1 Tax=Seminavis robusta TaxID=568900 RepID=A0A9N8HXM9_9STRA|nr:unknown protein [Seminavis robusta]|eukprot:Sro1836_g300660.1 n/a (297) ;mRNA; f:10226-11223
MGKKTESDLVSEDGGTPANPEAVTPSEDAEINLLDIVAARIDTHRTEEKILSFLLKNERKLTVSDLVSEEGGAPSNPKAVTPSDEDINLLDIVAARIEAYRNEEKISSFLLNKQKKTCETQDIAQPGAYAFAPTPSNNNDAEIVIEETRHDIEPAPLEQDSSGLAVAREVQDDPEDPRSLPQAEDYNENRESKKRNTQTQESNMRIALVLGFGLCLVVLVVLLVVLLGKTADGTEATLAMEPVESNNEDAPMHSNMAPSASPVFEQLLSYFPNYTSYPGIGGPRVSTIQSIGLAIG